MREAVPVLSNGADVGDDTRIDTDRLQEPLLTYERCEAKRSGSSTEADDSEVARWDEMIGLARKISGETFASFIVVVTLLAMKVNTEEWGSIATLAIALAGGLAVMVTIFSLGHVSGSHINPVVTIAYTLTRHFPICLAPLYVLGQLLGGILAASLVEFIYRPTKDIRAVGEFTGLAVGAIITIDILVVGPVSGGGINPARVLGPAIVYWNFPDVWIYIVGPIVGGSVGAMVYKLLRPEKAWRRNNYSLSSREIRDRTLSLRS